ncbi:MAG TPA: HAMP domain-containing sensor histidine kinase [Chryseosolibacter sp.]|nr:HAMP domain-containing sensor histidine kinase [Chryseosolibacter sp.]
MKNSTIRIIVILGAICIFGITITQLYWLRKAFDLKESEFVRTVNAALFNVAHQIYDINDTPSPAANPVKQVSTNYFIVMVNGDVDVRLLEFLLKSEFDKRSIKADFEYGIYDCSSEKMRYGDYVSLQATSEKVATKQLPAWHNYAYYFGVQFPARESNLINQMGIWSFSTFVLLVVIVFFAYTLFVILKQKRLSEIQKDFINNMTHEFKTPISTIAVSTEVLKDPNIVYQPERLRNYTGIIEKENIRLKQHVERVLQMARLDKEDIGLKKEAVDLHTLIRDAIKNTSHLVAEKCAEIKLNLSDADVRVDVDKLHMTNVFHNLIDNAMKYCEQTPSVEISSRVVNANLEISVKDNGIGISPENQKRVFQKFFRVSTGNVHDVKGFGLGLSYIKTIIEAHRGQIKLESQLEHGSTFKITLPLSR